MQRKLLPDFAVPMSANARESVLSEMPPMVPVAVAFRAVPLKWSFSENPSLRKWS